MKLNNKQKKQLKTIAYKVIGFAVLGVTGVVALAIFNKIKGRPLLEMKMPKKIDYKEKLEREDEVFRSTDKQ